MNCSYTNVCKLFSGMEIVIFKVTFICNISNADRLINFWKLIQHINTYNNNLETHPYVNFNAIIFQASLIVVRFDRRSINPEVERARIS